MGKGKVIYVAMPAFGEYWRNQNPYVSNVILSLIDRLLPRPIARTNTPAQVEMVLLRNGANLVINFVNHSGRERLLGYWYPLTEYMPLIRDIPVAVRVDNRKLTMRFEPSGKRVKYTVADGYAHITLPELEFMESIVVENYFA